MGNARIRVKGDIFDRSSLPLVLQAGLGGDEGGVARTELDDPTRLRGAHSGVEDVGVDRAIRAVRKEIGVRIAVRQLGWLKLVQVWAKIVEVSSLLVEIEVDPGEVALALPGRVRNAFQVRNRAVETLDDDLEPESVHEPAEVAISGHGNPA